MKYAKKGTYYPKSDKNSNKYKAKKTVVNGDIFPSIHEAERWCELCLLERTGKIFDLCRQVKYELIPSQKDIKTGRVIERSVDYIADFVYKKMTEDGGVITVVEDAKGVRTPDYIIKRKLMLYLKGIRILET